MRCIIAPTGPEDHGVRRIDVFSHGSLLRKPVQWLQQWFGACLMERCRKMKADRSKSTLQPHHRKSGIQWHGSVDQTNLKVLRPHPSLGGLNILELSQYSYRGFLPYLKFSKRNSIQLIFYITFKGRPHWWQHRIYHVWPCFWPLHCLW